MKALPDSQLLKAYAERRCEAAFAELARRHVDLVHSAALRMVKDPHLAKDVSQGVFVALAKDAAKLARHPVLCAWLHQTSRNIAAHTLRTEMRRRRREEAAAMMHETSGADATWMEVSALLDAALAELSLTDRESVLLRYFENKSTREIATACGIGEEAAQKRVTRAVEKLRQHLSRHGVTASAAGLAGLISAHAVQAAPAGLETIICAAARTAVGRAKGLLAMTSAQKWGMALSVAVIAGVVIHQTRQRPDNGTMGANSYRSARNDKEAPQGKSTMERRALARAERPAIDRQKELAGLKQRWLEVGSSNEKVPEQNVLAKESTRLLMCSREMLELLDFLTENTFHYAVAKTSREVEALFASPRAAEARQLLLTLPETAQLSGERSYFSETAPYRNQWSFAAGKGCPEDEFETFRTALACKSCGQDALYGRNLRLMETSPMEAFVSSLETFQSGTPSISGRYGVTGLFETTIPRDFDWAAAEQLLPADAEHDSQTPEEPPFREIRRKLFWSWAKMDPAAAGNHVLAHPERLGPELMGEIAGAYSYKDAAGLIAWIDQFPEGPYFDEAAASAASYARDRPGIQELIAKIKDPELRRRAEEQSKIPLTEPRTR